MKKYLPVYQVHAIFVRQSASCCGLLRNIIWIREFIKHYFDSNIMYICDATVEQLDIGFLKFVGSKNFDG